MPALTPDLAEEAARVDPDRTLATSFLTADARARVIALILFHNELARARSVVSEAGLCAIRLQWWRDTIEQIYTGKIVRAQPVAIALAATIEEVALPRALLDAMIDGYSFEIDPDPFQTWQDLERYLDMTHANLNRLSLLASGVTTLTTPLNTAAREAGIAWGLSYVLRETPKWFARRCIPLPLETLNGVDREGLYAGIVSQELRAIMGKMQARIKPARLACNLALGQAEMGQAFPIFASASLSSRYGKDAIPGIGQKWRLPPPPNLLTRQIRLTISIARQRI